jgi:hypothetical protein
MENKEIKWYSRPTVLISIWVLLGIITGLKQYLLSDVHSHINNFVIFKSSSGHFLNQMPLYLEYPKEYFDLYLYGPIFAILMVPFSWIPFNSERVTGNAKSEQVVNAASVVLILLNAGEPEDGR